MWIKRRYSGFWGYGWMVGGVQMSGGLTNIKLSRVNLFEWIVILVLIFGGAGLLIRVLVADGRRERRGRAEDPRIERTGERIDAIEAELERMKKDQ